MLAAEHRGGGQPFGERTTRGLGGVLLVPRESRATGGRAAVRRAFSVDRFLANNRSLSRRGEHPTRRRRTIKTEKEGAPRRDAATIKGLVGSERGRRH